MPPRPLDVAPPRVALPDPGLGRGWETSALLGLTLVILSFGLVTLYSASAFKAHVQGFPEYHFVVQQALGALVGLGIMAVIARVPYRLWRMAAWPLVALSFASLLLLILPWTPTALAPEINGARRWLRLGVTVQPSEFTKITVIVWTAMMAVRKQGQFQSLSKGLLPFLLVWGALLIPVAREPDLSTAVLLGLLGALTVFAAGGRPGHFVFLGLLVSPVLWLQLQVGYRRARLDDFFRLLSDPLDKGADGAGYQTVQSMLAMGSGGVAGRGFGQGGQKYGFLPEPHNDFIFAIIGEEWGFVGSSVMVLLFLALIFLGYRVARRAPDLFGQLLALGCTNLLALQAFLHIGVCVGLLPNTGLSLPLVSWGRSNLVVTLVALGILMAVARETDEDWHPDIRQVGRMPDLARADHAIPGGGRA